MKPNSFDVTTCVPPRQVVCVPPFKSGIKEKEEDAHELVGVHDYPDNYPDNYPEPVGSAENNYCDN